MTDTTDAIVEAIKQGIEAIDAARWLSGYQEEGLVGSDLTDWEREVIARAALAAALPLLREDMLRDPTTSDEVIDAAFKAVNYKYFGDYALSEGQWDAVWTMHSAAARLKAIRARFDAMAKEVGA